MKRELLSGWTRIFVSGSEEQVQPERMLQQEEHGIVLTDVRETDENPVEIVVELASESNENQQDSSTIDSDRQLSETIHGENRAPAEASTESPHLSENTEQSETKKWQDSVIGQLNKIEEWMNNDNHKDDLIHSLHQELEKHQTNLYSSMQRPFILSIIDIDKRMNDRIKYTRKLFNSAKEPEDYKNIAEQMCKNFQFDRRTLLDTLEDEYDLTYFEPVSGEKFNPKEHSVIKTIETGDSSLANTIQDVIYGGYKNQEDKVYLKSKVVVFKSK